MLLPFLLGLMGSYLLTPLIKKLAHKLGAVDYPNQRRVNIKPVPNIGGIAIYGGFIIALISLGIVNKLTGIIVSSSLIVLLGFIDDLYELSALTKLVGQIIAGLVLIEAGIKIEFITNPFGGMYYLGLLSIPVTLIWIVGVTNTINLIDGLDGLAGGVTITAAITLAILAYQQSQLMIVTLTVIIIGTALGFLRYNFNPAQIFMGDTGSMFLGFMLGVISIMGALKKVTLLTVIIALLALGVPIFDTLFAILRRKIKGQPIFKADKGHLHHKLLALGLKQYQVVLVVYLISIFLGMIAIGISNASIGQSLFLLVASMSFLVLGSYQFRILDIK